MYYWLSTLCDLFALEEYTRNLILLASGAAMDGFAWSGLVIGGLYWFWAPIFGYEKDDGFFTEERFPTKWRIVVFGGSLLIGFGMRFFG